MHHTMIGLFAFLCNNFPKCIDDSNIIIYLYILVKNRIVFIDAEIVMALANFQEDKFFGNQGMDTQK